MTPEPGTSLEYFEEQPATRIYNAYIHAAASMADLTAKGGNWRLPITHLILAPMGQAGDSKTYSFRFRWAPDYDGVREVLYQEKLFDVAVVPGMTVPIDLDVESAKKMLKLRDVLDEMDDVQNIYSNDNIPEAALA